MLDIVPSIGLIDLKKLDNAISMAIEAVYIRELTLRTPKKTSYTAGQWTSHSLGNFTYLITNPNGEVVKVLEGGRKSGIIQVKNKKFMRFKIPKSRVSPKHAPLPGNIAFEKDGYIFTKKVLHPGFEGRFFIKEIFSDKGLEKEFEEKLVIYIKRTMK